MKKKIERTKLTLDLQTVRILDDGALGRAVGGHVTTILVWLTGTCKCDDTGSNSASIRGSR